MGAVYRGHHVFLDEDRAIKIIRGESPNPVLVERFVREARILAKLQHENLARLYEFGTLDETMFFLALELINGETVEQRLSREGRIPIKQAIRFARQAADGLGAAHQSGILHRDVCPSHLWLVKNASGEEIVRVSGFAIAKPTAEETKALSVSLFIPEYQSPEQYGWLEPGESLDQRTDIYSLSVSLYKMLSGEHPFASSVPRGTPVPLSSLVPDLSPTLERFILKNLSLNRNERDPSMQDVVRQLDELLAEASTTARTPVQVKPKTKFDPGSVFAGRYVIEKRLGKGGMGTVYKATDRIIDQPVAIKTLNKDLAEDENTLTRFKREVILARKVTHPGVCRIYDIGESEGVHYVSMEYVEGMTLADLLLTRGALAPADGLPIIKQVLSALAEAHRLGIVHRDLKPQNIMVDPNQRACIMDFGISISNEATRLTAIGQMIGTPRYMAPEQFSEANADQRSDLYSACLIVYEMFTGQLPFTADTPAGAMYAHLYTEPLPPSRIVPDFPKRLEQVILKGLGKNPQARYQTASELLAALESAVALRPYQKPVMPRTLIAPAPSAAAQTILTKEPDALQATPETMLIQEPSRSYRGVLIALMVMALALGAGWWYYKISKGSSSAATQVPASAPKPTSMVPSPRVPEAAPSIPSTVAPEPPVPQTVATPAPESQPETATQNPEPEAQPVAENVPEPPATPAAAGNGSISYQGEFPVSIYSNNKLILNTASTNTLELPPGVYSLTLVSKENAIIRLTEKVEVKPGQPTIVPSPPMSQLTLTCEPEDCTASVDMVPVAMPLTGFPIQAGNHILRVRWESLNKEKTAFFTLSPNQAIALRGVSNATTTDVLQVVHH